MRAWCCATNCGCRPSRCSAPLASRRRHRALDDVVSPYAFLDVGYGYNYNLNALQSLAQDANTTLVGLGAGIDYTLARNIQAGALAGVALTNGPETDRGTVTVQGRVSISF